LRTDDELPQVKLAILFPPVKESVFLSADVKSIEDPAFKAISIVASLTVTLSTVPLVTAKSRVDPPTVVLKVEPVVKLTSSYAAETKSIGIVSTIIPIPKRILDFILDIKLN
jgi:hypothetical protein